MNEISHQQAQFLIRKSADRRLPEEQWSALQAHLERCAACRAYAVRQTDLERGTRRALLARWRPVEVTIESLGGKVTGFRQKRSDRRRTTWYGIFCLAAALVIVLLSRTPGLLPGSGGALSGARLLNAPPSATPTIQPTPTRLPEDRFVGVVAYESTEEGSSDIFLLNVTPNDGGEKINLTANPAHDSGPSWSPDGEWVAFLSDRTGKRELFVISVAGTRLTQLTAEALIDWQGVPQWSSDGHWISLSGKRLDQDLDSWVYLVPLDGGRPVSLPGTRGSPGGARFSPLMPLLAVPTADGGVLAYSTATGWRSRVLGLEEFSPGARFAGIDWAFGESLVYQVSGPVGSSIAIRGPFGPAGSVAAASSDQDMLVRSAGVLQRSLAFQPGGAMIATLREGTSGGTTSRGAKTPGNFDCWSVYLMFSFVYDEAQVAELPGLCALSELESASWHSHCCLNPGGSWLVLAAQPAGQEQAPGNQGPGIYALRAEGRPSPDQPPIYERLADLPSPLPVAPPTRLPVAPVPRMRPVRGSLNIVPAPAAVLGAAAGSPSAIPQNLPGSLLLAQPDPGGDATLTAIYRADPGGENHAQLLPADAANRCPVWSPDRAQIAFLSDRATREANPALRGPDELFVMDAQGEQITQVTRAAFSGRAAVNMPNSLTCPAWSPDGKYLAVVTRVGQGGGVMVLTPSGQVARYLPSDQVSANSTPVWTPDGGSLLLAQPALRGTAPRIVEVPWHNFTGSRTLAILTGWDDIHGLSVSPDGQEIAFILVREASDDGPAQAYLRVVSLPDMRPRYRRQLLGYDPAAITSPGRIAWMQERQVVFAVPHSPLEPHKASLLRYAPADDTVQTLAYLDDVLFDWAVNGAWLYYSTESGQWGLPVNGRLDPQPVPRRLSPNPALNLSWR